MNRTPDVGETVQYRGKKWIVVAWENTGGTTICNLVSDDSVCIPGVGRIRACVDNVPVEQLEDA